MKYDIKMIIIIILLLTSVLFGLSWYLSGDDVSKERVKQLEKDYKKLEEEKKLIDKNILYWKEKFNMSDLKDKKLQLEIDKIKSDVKLAKDNANKSKKELDIIRSNSKKIIEEIEEIKRNPKVLTDDELLKELTKKTR